MAQKVQVLLVDDLDGGEADETVTFALDGKTYEIDLTTANADKLRGLLDPYTKGGRRTGGRAAGGRGKARVAAGGQPGHREDPRVGEGERLRGQRPRPCSGDHPRGLREGQRLIAWPIRQRCPAARRTRVAAGPVALRRHRVHESYEIGGAPIAPHGRPRRQRGFHLAPRLGGSQPHGGPLHGGAVPGAPAAGAVDIREAPAAVILPPRADRAVRSSATAPHSSQSSSPGSSSALPAATSSRIRRPCTATGAAGGRRRSSAKPARPALPGRRSATTGRAARARSARAAVAQPSSFSYHWRGAVDAAAAVERNGEGP